MPNQSTKPYIGKHVAERTWFGSLAELAAIGDLLTVPRKGRHS